MKKKGSLNCSFIGVKANGSEVVKSYSLKIVGKVNARLEKENELVKCLESEVKYTLLLLSGDTDGTQYFLNYDDKSGEDELERSKLVGGKGVFVHKYTTSYCNMLDHDHVFKVALRYKNECYQGELATVSEYVAVPFKANFTFDRLGKGKVCTYEKIDLRNITGGGTGSDCSNANAIAFWDFGNGETSEEWQPYIEYKDVDPYKIKLKVSNDYVCATDSVEYPVDLINRTKAIMRPDKDELCVGEELIIENDSRGDEVDAVWSVVSLDGFSIPKYDPSDWHLKLKFNHWGKYRITLSVSNVCSRDQTDTVITVRQNPDLIRYAIPEKACLPEEWDMSDLVNVEWNGNEEKAEWNITRVGGLKNDDVEWLNGTSAASAFPIIRFKRLGEYNVTIRLPDAGCGGTKLTETKTVMVYDPDIKVDIDTTPLNICENGTVAFTNKSVGDNLQYEWTVKPTTVEFVTGTDMGASPVIRFKKYGDYEVKLHMYTHSGCGVVDTVYKVHVRKDSRIFFFEPPEAVCPGPDYPFSFSGSVLYEFWNNPRQVKWTILPDNGGWEFLNGSNEHSLEPTLLFKTPGDYHFTVELESVGCPEDGYDRLLTKDIRVRNSAMSMQGIVANTLVCEGDGILFSLSATTAENDPLLYAWTVSPEDGMTKFDNTGNTKKAAKITFHHWGDYQVNGAVSGYCGRLDTTFDITVQKDPRVKLRDGVNLCLGQYDMKEYVTYQWFNNIPEVKWTVKQLSGVGGSDGFSIDNSGIEYPKITFNKPGDYSVKVELVSHTLGCESDSLLDIKKIHIYDPDIFGDITMVGNGEICEGQMVTFMNTTNVDGGVRWEWWVEGQEDGCVFQDGGKTSTVQLPEITFSKYGNYQVFAKAIGPCSEKEFPPFSVTVSGIPEITVDDVSGVCEPFDFESKKLIHIDSRNDAVRSAQWIIAEKPGSVSEGYEYLGGTSEMSIYPDVRFHHGDYVLEVKYWNRCQTPGTKTFHIRADEFVPITDIRDDAICSQSPEARLLTAVPDTGVWALKNTGIPNAGEIVIKRGDRYYFNPKFGAYDEQDVKLVYKLYNHSCVDIKEMTMHVWALPYVEAGVPLEMCLNHKPRLLMGRDSLVGTVWQQNRGHWDWDGIVLAEHYFRADSVGDFKLFYRYEDFHQCTNVDSTVMTVHALPDTAFISQPHYCRGVLADFIVNKSPEGKQYMWQYYSGAEWEVLPGDGGYVYERAGYYDVTLIAESVYGCLDTSSSHRIEIVDDAPQADFTMSPHNECGPEVELTIEVKQENYSDHNLHFEWVLGNGTVSDALVPDNPQLFYSTSEDTVYQIKFKVYNICNETVKVDSLTVGSVPHVHFVFENGERNCSPLALKVLNTSTGSNNRYLWYMGDGKKPLSVFEPLDYVYVTDTLRRVFEVSLVAENQCGKDSLMRPLTVLAQTLRAFFNRPKDDICVGEQICFTNHTRDTSRDIAYKYWDFGDAVRDTSWNACHVYRDSGIYKVLLFVDNGCSSDTTSKYVHVIGNPKVELQVERENCDRDTFHFAFTTDQRLRWVKWSLNDSTVFAPSFRMFIRNREVIP